MRFSASMDDPEEITKLREDLGFSGRGFARFLHVTPTSVHRWERPASAARTSAPDLYKQHALTRMRTLLDEADDREEFVADLKEASSEGVPALLDFLFG